MSEPIHPEEKRGVTVHYVSVVTCERPTDIETRITQHEFEMICAGDANKEETKRDNAKNLFAAALLGLAGVLASADWSTGFRQRPSPFYFFICLFLLALAWFGNAWRVFYQEAKAKQGDSIHSRMIGDIRKRFAAYSDGSTNASAQAATDTQVSAKKSSESTAKPHDR